MAEAKLWKNVNHFHGFLCLVFSVGDTAKTLGHNIWFFLMNVLPKALVGLFQMTKHEDTVNYQNVMVTDDDGAICGIPQEYQTGWEREGISAPPPGFVSSLWQIWAVIFAMTTTVYLHKATLNKHNANQTVNTVELMSASHKCLCLVGSSNLENVLTAPLGGISLVYLNCMILDWNIGKANVSTIHLNSSATTGEFSSFLSCFLECVTVCSASHH